MLGLFNKGKKSIQITSEFIGVMTFVDKTDDGDSYWIGAKEFIPNGQTVEYIIYNGIEGPSTSQIELSIDIEKRYVSLTVPTGNLINKNFKGSKFKIGENLRLSFVTIPREPLDKSDFSMTFERTDNFGLLEIDYKNWEPSDASLSA